MSVENRIRGERVTPAGVIPSASCIISINIFILRIKKNRGKQGGNRAAAGIKFL